MPTYYIRIASDSNPDGGEPHGSNEETLAIEADSLGEARSRAVLKTSVRAKGRLLRAYDAATGSEVLSPAPNPLRPGRFQIDGLAGTYDGYTRGETWNGFAVPYFPLAEARRIAGHYAAQPPMPDGQTAAEFDDERALVRLYDPSSEEWDEFGPVEIEGLTLYPVGTHLWTWEETTG